MGLTSSLSTALTGMTAAESQIDVLGNNLANSQTVGFKSSTVQFATQFLQTLSVGGSPTEGNGGTNPRQIGLGTKVAGITPKFTQGTVQISSSPSDLAIQGDGFFMVEAGQGERLYTRNGIFKLNSQNQLVTTTGNRLLGYTVDGDFKLQTTKLAPLAVPLGAEAVAAQTQNVTMEGALSAKGAIADTGEVIESIVLGDATIPRPDVSAARINVAPVPNVTGTTVSHADGGGTHPEGATYLYKMVFVDASGKESVASNTITATTPASNGSADNRIVLNNLPTSTEYSQLRIYRTTNGGSTFNLLTQVPTGGSFTDNNSIPLSSTPLNTTNLDGNYSYMVTYFKAGEKESRPSPALGPVNVVNGRIHLSNLPTPPPAPSDGSFPQYDGMRIYRNLSNDPNSFFLVDTVPAGKDYTDNKTDAQISNLSISGNQALDLNGPTISSNTKLINVLRRDGFEYTNLYKEGTLTFTGKKGGRNLESKTFTVTSGSTVSDLMRFMQDALGIQNSINDSVNPIPRSKNNITGETGTLSAGAYIINGKMRIVSNNGVDNAVSIDLTSFVNRDTVGQVTTPNLAFGSVQKAVGQSTVADFIAYDSLGLPIRARITATLESRNGTSTVYRWYADSADNSLPSGSGIAVGTGLVTFDGVGNFVAATNNTVAIQRNGYPSVSPMQFALDFKNVSGLATDRATLAAARQDGSPPGTLTSYIIGEDGLMRGVFSNGISRDLGQIRLARFSNPEGLEQRGENLLAQGINTGLPIEGQPGQNGIGSVVSGALELSNTDVGGDLVNLVLASTQYRGNARVITATQQLFDELLNLRR